MRVHRSNCWALWVAFCALWLALSGGAAQALDPERAIRQLPHVWYQEKLQQNTVLSIAQRADGAIWLATYAGLVRHSGVGFDTFDQRNMPALRSNSITALLADSGGTLWIGTLNGGLYRSRGRELEAVELPKPIESVFVLAEDRAKTLWLATNAGIARLDASGAKLFDADSGFPRGPYRAMVADADGGIWVGIEGVGVAHWRDGHVEVLGREHGLPSLAVYAVRIDRAGTVWVGTQTGLVRWRDGRFEREPLVAALVGQRIHSLLGDHDGNLWITAQGMGLCRLTAARLDCQRSVRGVSNDIVRSMIEDREGNVWIGTTHSGLHRISDSKLVTVTGRLDSNTVRTVFEDASGTLWIGTDGAGLASLHDHALVASESNSQLLSPFLRALAGDAAGNLWVGSIEGLSRISPVGGVRNFRVEDGLPGAIVFALAPSRDGSLWVGTTVGLARVAGDDITPVAVAKEDIRALHEAADGRLWIGQRSGLRCLQGSVFDRCGTDGLSNASVFAFHPAADGSMWLGTSQGLMRWREGRVVPYGTAMGMAGDAVFTILDDAAGHFWISTNRGIVRIAQRDIEALDRGAIKIIAPTWFGKSDGMLSSQGSGASQSPGVRARDGRLWIGTANGVVMVDPTRLRRNLQPPPVAIERVRADGIDLDPARLQGIGPDVDRMEFHYAGMSYVAPEAVRYRYRLEGYDRDWVEAGDRRVAYYTNLSPRDYVFRVIAGNNDGVWNEAGSEVGFAILPSVQESAWFRALMVLAALVVVAGFYRYRIWRVRANERELMREVELRTVALRAANAELTRMASLDGLTRIANRGAFDQALERSWVEHRSRGVSLALLLCDIDSFKAYNDNYGHQAGDVALIRVAGTLVGLVRSDADLAARYGGEELALLLSDCDATEAVAVAQRVLDAVRGLGIEHRASSVAPHVTISIGVVVIVPSANQGAHVAIRLADVALYRAKAEGRDRVCGPDSRAFVA